MGWVLVGVAAYVITPLISHDLVESGLLAGVAIAAGAHLGWFERSGGNLRGFSHLKKFLGVILIGGGILYLVSAAHEREGIKWMPYDQDLISTALNDEKPLILDFYADWCVPCREMERDVFKDPEIVKTSRNFMTMRLDLTQRQPFQGEILAKYRVRGVPTIIFFNGEGEEEKAMRRVDESCRRAARVEGPQGRRQLSSSPQAREE